MKSWCVVSPEGRIILTNPRMSVTFTEPQMEFLTKEAERLGISVAEAVRRIIDATRT